MVTPPWPVFIVLATWWLSTGLVLALVWLGRPARWGTMALATVAAGVGALGVWTTRGDTSVLGVYGAFASALALWAWHELSFLLGVVTGSWRERCPPGTSGWQRFGFATRALIHHELALAGSLLALLVATRGAQNQVAAATFGALWLMRFSTKLNIFFGVRYLTEEFIPPHLQYLRSFFRQGRSTPLLPISIALGSALTCVVLSSVLDPSLGEGPRLGRLVVGTLLALGVLEHLFLALPFREAALWRRLLRLRSQAPLTPGR